MTTSNEHTFTIEECQSALWPDSAIPSKSIRCRHCQRLNKVSVAKAVFHGESCKCGSCHQSLFISENAPLTGLAPSYYEHPLDHNYLQILRTIPGLPQLLKLVISQLSDRASIMTLLANNIRCGEAQFPELVRLLNQARLRLDIAQEPTLFLGQSPFVNAATSGVDNGGVIVIKTALIDLLAPEEILAVLGHELGHQQAEHLLYHQLATMLIFGSQLFTDIGKLLSTPLRLALLKWYRCSELTADRASLLACGNLPATLGLMIKMAGSPSQSSRYRLALKPFIEQIRELSKTQDSNMLDNILGSLVTLGNTHPDIAWRVMHLISWVEEGNYLNILAGEYQHRANN